jgi:hypothetical protein
MTITENGRVGIGTDAPTAQLQVAGGNLHVGKDGDIDSKLRVNSDTAGAYFTIENFGNYGGHYATGIDNLVMANNKSGGYITFNTTDGTMNEAVRINYQGKVGIGTDTPLALLDVDGTARVLASYEGAAAVATTSTAYTIPDLTRNIRRLTLDDNTTITLPVTTSIPTDAVYSVTIKVKQDATGSRTLAWASGANSIKWDNGSAPAPASGANEETIYQFMIIGGETTWYGSMVWKEN